MPLIALSWSSWFPAPLSHDDYMNKKMIIAWRETVKENIPNPVDPKETIKVVWTKIHFVASGKTFPEDDVMQRVDGRSDVCGTADGVMDIFKVFDADPGGIMRWSYRGNIMMGDRECPFGETVPYPGYNPDLDPDRFTEKLGLFQDCWLSVWGPNGLQEKMRCGQSSYTGYANLKGVAPAGNSPDVFHFIVMSDDGISAIPFSKLQEVMRVSGIEISTDQFFNLITQINGDPENPTYAPIWETWRWK
jgi:hypothetical protein